MKKIYQIMIACIALMFASCVQDAQLQEATFVKMEVDVQVEENGIKLAGRILNDENWPIEKIGFCFEREWENRTDMEEILVDVNGTFETKISQNLQDGLSCRVYSFAIVGSNLFRSESKSFTAKGSAEMQIESMYVQPDKHQVTGTLVLQGKNLSRFSHLVELKLDTVIAGEQSFRLVKCSEEELTFNYTCCHIGSFPMRLAIGDQSQRLHDKLEIKGPVFNEIPESIGIGVPIELKVEDPYGMRFSYFKAEVQGNNVLQDRLYYGGKEYITFETDSPSITVQFAGNAQHLIYFPPIEIKMESPWEKQYNFEGPLEPQLMWKDYACIIAEEEIKLVHIPTGKIDIYPHDIVKSYFKEWGYTTIKVTLVDDIVYVCYYIQDVKDIASRKYTVALSFDLKTRQWNNLGILSDEKIFGQPRASETYNAIAQKGDEIYLFYRYLCKVVVWNTKTDIFEIQDISLWEPNTYPNLLGQWKDHFYFMDRNIREVKLGDWESDKDVAYGDFETSNQIGSYLKDGYYYHDAPMRRYALDSDTGLRKIEYLGYPKESYRHSRCTILPCDSGIWCYDREGSIYRYTGDFYPIIFGGN